MTAPERSWTGEFPRIAAHGQHHRPPLWRRTIRAIPRPGKRTVGLTLIAIGIGWAVTAIVRAVTGGWDPACTVLALGALTHMASGLAVITCAT